MPNSIFCTGCIPGAALHIPTGKIDSSGMKTRLQAHQAQMHCQRWTCVEGSNPKVSHLDGCNATYQTLVQIRLDIGEPVGHDDSA